MSTPLRKVSENYHLTLKRARIASVVSPFYDVAPNGNNGSPKNTVGVGGSSSLARAQLPSHIIWGVTKTGDRSKSSFDTLPLKSIFPPGLYTAIAHNGPLRRRIEEHYDELEDFKAHVRYAQEILFGWMATLYHLMLVVVWYTLVCACRHVVRVNFKTFFKGYTISHLAGLHKLLIPAKISGNPYTVRIKQALSLRTLLTIRDLILESIGRLRSLFNLAVSPLRH